MEERLINTVTAKLAREKGFDIKVEKYWCNYYTGEPLNKWKLLPSDKLSMNWMEFSAPTQGLLQKWLREKHNIDVWAQPFVMKNSEESDYLPDESYSYFLFKDGVWIKDEVDFLDFEEALETGLQEALKQIP